MADSTSQNPPILTSAMKLPIAQLNPDLPSPASTCVAAVVSLIWPYSSVKGSLTILLAEPDYRLRRANGQVRVQFSGSSAKAVAQSGIGSGDEVILSLDGAEWARDETSARTPGSSIAWELRFREKLSVQIRRGGTTDAQTLEVDHPEPQPNAESPPTPDLSTFLSEVDPVGATPAPVRPSLVQEEDGGEWQSPAFIKRARTSYGSLFDDGYDIFTEEGKAKKRRKLNRPSAAWRYASVSPSPEPEEEEVVEEPRVMMDSGCQTMGLEGDEDTEILAIIPGDLGFGRSMTQMQGREIRPENHIQDSTMDFEEATNSLPPPPQLLIPPSSPRLGPIPSDALPLVSPLVDSQQSALGDYLDKGDSEAQNGLSDSSTAEHSAAMKPSEYTRVADADNENSAAPEAEMTGQPETLALEGQVQVMNGGRLTPENQDEELQIGNDFSRSMSPHGAQAQLVSYPDLASDNRADAEVSGPDYNQPRQSEDAEVHNDSKSGTSYEQAADGDLVRESGEPQDQMQVDSQKDPEDEEEELEEAVPNALNRGDLSTQHPVEEAEGEDDEDNGDHIMGDQQRPQSISGDDLQQDIQDEVEEDELVAGRSQLDNEYDEDEMEEDQENQEPRDRVDENQENQDPGDGELIDDVDEDEENEDPERNDDLIQRHEYRSGHVAGFEHTPLGVEAEEEEYYDEEEEEDFYDDEAREQILYDDEEGEDALYEDEEEEEELYDDEGDEEDEPMLYRHEPQPPAQGTKAAPVFIDLLSSDDEDEAPTKEAPAQEAPVQDSPASNAQEEDAASPEAPTASPRAIISYDGFPETLGDDDTRDDADEALDHADDATAQVGGREEDEALDSAGEAAAEQGGYEDEDMSADDGGRANAVAEGGTEPLQSASGPPANHDEVDEDAGADADEDKIAEPASDEFVRRELPKYPDGNEAGDLLEEHGSEGKEAEAHSEEEASQQLETQVFHHNNYSDDSGPGEFEGWDAESEDRNEAGDEAMQEIANDDDASAEIANQMAMSSPAREPEVDDDVQMAEIGEEHDNQMAEDAVQKSQGVEKEQDERISREEGVDDEKVDEKRASPEPTSLERPDDETSQRDQSEDSNAVILELSSPQAEDDGAQQTVEDAIQETKISTSERAEITASRQAEENTHTERPSSMGLDGADDGADDDWQMVDHQSEQHSPPKDLTWSPQNGIKFGNTIINVPKELAAQRATASNAQLPTPDATQAASFMISQEISQSQVTEEESTQVVETIEEKTIIEVMGMSDVAMQEETTLEESIQEDLIQEDLIQEEVIQEEVIQEEVIQEEVIQEETIQQETNQEETNQEEMVQEDKAEEDIIQEETTTVTSVVEKTMERPVTPPARSTRSMTKAKAASEAPTTPERPRSSHQDSPGSFKSAGTHLSPHPPTGSSAHMQDIDNISFASFQDSPQPDVSSVSATASQAVSRESPAPPTAPPRTPPTPGVRNVLKRIINTPLATFTPLRSLKFLLNQPAGDFLAIVASAPTAPTRAKGPRHYQMSFNVVDGSNATPKPVEVNVYRPHIEALPHVSEGDGILLRGFQVQSLKGRGFGLKSGTDASAWAVFKRKGHVEDREVGDGDVEVESVEIRGPHVEWGAAEKKHVEILWGWYDALTDNEREKIRRENERFEGVRRENEGGKGKKGGRA